MRSEMFFRLSTVSDTSFWIVLWFTAGIFPLRGLTVGIKNILWFWFFSCLPSPSKKFHRLLSSLCASSFHRKWRKELEVKCGKRPNVNRRNAREWTHLNDRWIVVYTVSEVRLVFDVLWATEILRSRRHAKRFVEFKTIAEFNVFLWVFLSLISVVQWSSVIRNGAKSLLEINFYMHIFKNRISFTFRSMSRKSFCLVFCAVAQRARKRFVRSPMEQRRSIDVKLDKLE